MGSKKNAKNKLTTSKKQKFMGVTHFIDPQTGEIVPMQITKVEERDFNFHKVWLQNMVIAFEGITNRKMELAFWIINHINKENQLIGTQRQIADATGLSLTTVRDTMKMLQEGKIPFLIRINAGAYQINPDIVWKGSHTSRMGILLDYSDNEMSAENTNKTNSNANADDTGNNDNETDTD